MAGQQLFGHSSRAPPMLVVLVFAALPSCLLKGAGAAALSAVRWDRILKQYVDSDGRVRIFHGVNVVYKEWPWLPPSGFSPQSSLGHKDIALLESWGFNLVRLGAMWPGVEPSLGVIDHAYIQKLADLAERLANKGVYSLLDLHQDVGSRRFCGEGFPEHYVDTLLANSTSDLSRAKPFPAPYMSALKTNSTGFPLLQDCLKHPFAEYYATSQVGALWRELYTPGTSMRKGFNRFWRAVAEAFARKEHVLGYELLNEPSGWCLSSYCFPTEPIDNSVERDFLTPLYKEAASEIRRAGAQQLIFYEPTVFPKVLHSAFPAPALGDDEQQGLAYHIYCQPGDGTGVANALLCRAAQDLYAHGYYQFLDTFPVAGLMTEFGAIGNSSGELEHMERLLGFADDHLQSWAYWQLKLYKDFTTANAEESLYDPEGHLEGAKLKSLSRTYAQAIAGMPLKMHFDPGTAEFELTYNMSGRAKGPTEVFLNEELHYPHGFTVSVDPIHCASVQHRTSNRLLVLHITDASGGTSCAGQVIHLKVSANSTTDLIV